MPSSIGCRCNTTDSTSNTKCTRMTRDTTKKNQSILTNFSNSITWWLNSKKGSRGVSMTTYSFGNSWSNQQLTWRNWSNTDPLSSATKTRLNSCSTKWTYWIPITATFWQSTAISWWMSPTTNRNIWRYSIELTPFEGTSPPPNI